MITKRNDGTYVIEYKGGQYHVIEEDTEVWDLVKQRIEDGEETQFERPFQPSEDYVFNEDLFVWELPTEKYNSITSDNRKQAYQTESDPLFFEWQQGEIEKQVWLDKIQEIKGRYKFI